MIIKNTIGIENSGVDLVYYQLALTYASRGELQKYCYFMENSIFFH